MLILPIKKKWFDLIKSGEKTTEYREYKDFYHQRFANLHNFETGKVEQPIMLRNGYRKDSPSIIIEVESIDVVIIKNGIIDDKPVCDKKYYAIRIKGIRHL